MDTRELEELIESYRSAHADLGYFRGIKAEKVLSLKESVESLREGIEAAEKLADEAEANLYDYINQLKEEE